MTKFGDRMADFKASAVHQTTEKERTEANLRPTGEELFDAMTKAEQDEAFGPEIATALRSGDVSLADLVVKNRLANEPDFITQASPVDLGIKPKDKT